MSKTDTDRPDTFDLRWIECRQCGSQVEGGHSTSAVTALELHTNHYHN
jgi:hypothetical protein